MAQNLAAENIASKQEFRQGQLEGTRLMGLAGTLGTIVFAVLVTIAGIIEGGYSHVSQKISELGGVTAEYGWIQNSTSSYSH